MKEPQIQTMFTKKNKVYGAFELKLIKSNRFDFKRLKDHQIDALVSTVRKGLTHKIQDEGWSSVSRKTYKKPYDCIKTPPMDAYVVLVWYVPRKRKTAYYVKIYDYIEMVMLADRKSATEEMVKRVASNILELNNE